MADDAFVGPFGESNFADELRLGPNRTSQTRVLRYLFKRPFLDRDSIEHLFQLDPQRVTKTGAGTPGVDQFSLVVKTKHERTERQALVRKGVACDDKLLSLNALDLQPVAAARRFVNRVGQL